MNLFSIKDSMMVGGSLSFNVGDIVFNRKGQPSVVTGRDASNETIEAEMSGEKFEVARKKNFINGLNPEGREIYDEIISEISEDKEVSIQIQKLEEKLVELRQDPRKFLVTRYVEAQLGHLMNTNRINPRTFVVDSDNVR